MNRHALLLLLVLSAAGCNREQDGVIAFQSNRDGNFEIYTMDALGGTQRRLTENSANDIAPCWSPDGTRIAFASDRDGTWDIYTMRGDGGDLKQLTKGAGSNTAPSWTPSGDRILFVSTRDEIYGDVYRMNADGSGTERLTADTLVKDTPLLTPDGKTVIVTVNNRARLSIAAIDLATRKTKLLTPQDHDSFSPALSATGNEVMFVSDRDGKLQLYSMGADGANQIRLTIDGVDERTPCFTATPGVILASKKGGICQIALPAHKETVLSFKGDIAPSWHTR